MIFSEGWSDAILPMAGRLSMQGAEYVDERELSSFSMFAPRKRSGWQMAGTWSDGRPVGCNSGAEQGLRDVSLLLLDSGIFAGGQQPGIFKHFDQRFLKRCGKLAIVPLRA